MAFPRFRNHKELTRGPAVKISGSDVFESYAPISILNDISPMSSLVDRQVQNQKQCDRGRRVTRGLITYECLTNLILINLL